MSLADRIQQGLSAFRNPVQSKTTDFKPTKTDLIAPPQSAVGAFTSMPVPPNKRESTYLAEGYQSWAYSAIQAISREVASIQLVLRQKKGNDIVEIEEHESISILHQANRFTTFYQLVEITQIYQELAGEAFWVLLRPENAPIGDILEIWPLRPDWFDIVEDEKEFIKGYLYKPPGFASGIAFPSENVVHFKFPNPINPYRGKGSVEAASLAIDTDIFSAEWNRNFFFNSALPDVMFTTDQNITKETLDRLKTAWDQNYKGRSNAHKVGWLTSGFKPEPLSASPKDADFLEQRRLVRDEILAVFGVPKSVIGVTEDVNRANAEASKAVFLENTVKARMTRFVSHLNEFYLRQFAGTEEMFFDFEDPSPTDVEGQINIVNAGKDNFLTINESREALGFEPIDGGDVIYKPLNVLPTIGENPIPNPITQPKPSQPQVEQPQDQQQNLLVIPGTRTEKKKKFVMPIAPKRVEEIRIKQKLLDNGGNTDFIKLIGFMMKNKKVKTYKKANGEIIKEKKGNTPSGWTQEAKDRYWEEKIARTDPQEKVFKQKLIELMGYQEERVLQDLNSIRYYTAEAKKAYKVEKQFEVAAENKVFAGVMMPFIREFMIDAGAFALFQLGFNQAFDSATENAVSYLMKEGAAFINDPEGINTTTLKALKKTLAEGIGNNESIPQLRNRVREVYSGITKNRVNMIARTEVSRAVNFGTYEAYIQSGVVLRKEFSTARDERVCPFCNSLDGKTVSVEDNFFKKGESLTVDGKTLEFGLTDVPAPPLHVSCRCSLIPVVE